MNVVGVPGTVQGLRYEHVVEDGKKAAAQALLGWAVLGSNQ
jgi:hypothetical protein